MRRKTLKDYHTLASEHGFEWLGPEVPDTHTKTTWLCSEGHEWETTYGTIQSGANCPFCIGHARLVPEDYRNLAAERGFEWLGPEVPNNRTKTIWRCSKGHEWETAYDHISRGKGCPYCSNRVPKTPQDYRVLAAKRGFEWIGPEVPNTATKTGWRCSEGHEWQATYTNIRKRGCPHCAGLTPLTSADYHALATKRGFEWIGPELINNRTKTGWRCENGHEWKAPYASIQRGLGCPYCAGRARKTARDYRTLAAERGFQWLGTKAPTVMVKTIWRCSEGHEWEASYDNISHGSGCPICAGNLPLTPGDYRSLAAECGLEWLGPEVPNSSTKTTWRCSKGHEWELDYTHVKRNNGCPKCRGFVNGKRVSQRQRDLCEMLGGELNYPAGNYYLDIALFRGSNPIDVEYDAWYWHEDKLYQDAERDTDLIAQGWRILRVRSDNSLPTPEQLQEAIQNLCNGETFVEIILSDWGE